MRILISLTLGLLLSINLFGQEDSIAALVLQGTELHEQGKYVEAIAKFKSALELDKNSSLANYSLSLTYLITKQYDEAIKCSKKAIDKNAENLEEAYMVLGSAEDGLGKPDKAIKIYEEGLRKFPGSNLLNYNLAMTSYIQKDYKTAEKAAINAVIAKPNHGSSHLLLFDIMSAEGQRARSLLPLYYFLMLEPNSIRSQSNYVCLIGQLNQGVNRESEAKINVKMPSSTSDKDFGSADMMISFLAASKHLSENRNKSDLDFLISTSNGFFSILGEAKKDKNGFWWDFYVNKFYDLIQSGNCEAFSYYISQSTDSGKVKKWMAENPEKIQKLKDWIDK